MFSKKKQLNNCKLYLILDTSVKSYDELLKITRLAVSSGVDIVQLRDKQGSAQNILAFSKEILKITRRKTIYIMNDRVDLALASGADGVHLGQEDLSVAFARKSLGSKAIIGTSCQSLAHLKKAQREQADYVGFGSVFKTLTKPERFPMDLKVLRRVSQTAKIPVFAIGGIKLSNLTLVRQAGIERVAVCREICLAKNIKSATSKFKEALDES
jgi:thiamine-phosphate pyrophosphorylase